MLNRYHGQPQGVESVEHTGQGCLVQQRPFQGGQCVPFARRCNVDGHPTQAGRPTLIQSSLDADAIGSWFVQAELSTRMRHFVTPSGSLARNAGHDWDWRQVQEKRDEREKAMRARTGERYADHEACYPQFMAETLQAIFGDSADDALLSRVTDYEIAMENTMLVPRRDIVAWLRELSAAGVRVLVLSDIYLPASHLQRLLAHAGILPYEETQRYVRQVMSHFGQSWEA